MSRKFFKLSLVLAVVALMASGCSLPWKKKAATDANSAEQDVATTTITAGNTGQLKKFNNYEELGNFLSTNANSVKSPNQNSVSGSASNLFDYSKRKDLVTDGSQSDIVKVDGQFVYALVKNELSIIKNNSAKEAEVISKVTFKSRPQGILVSGNYLAVFGNDTQISSLPVYQNFRRQSSYTFFKVFDVSDPANPKQVRDLDFEGSYLSARLEGDHVFFLTAASGNYVAGEPLAPRTLDNGSVLSTTCDGSEKCFAPDVFYFDIPYTSVNYDSLTSINIKDYNEPISGQVYLLDDGQDFYVSQNNIYITYTSQLNEFSLRQAARREIVFSKLSAEDQAKINNIEASPNYVLNDNEKKNKTAQIIDNYINSLSDSATLQTEIENNYKQKIADKAKDSGKTTIYKFSINSNKIGYRAIGEVPGQLLNRFSLDENGGYLRLVTARNKQLAALSEVPTDSYSNIYILDDNLKIVGRLENLATTEQIFSAYFIGERVYLVATESTDPLYVISVKDPSKPQVLGAIKVSGASYLQPADANGTKLIGLGRDIETATGGNTNAKGLKLTLFDFTDLAKPKELDSYLIGDSLSDSIALTDHQAFLYSESSKILTLPTVFRNNLNRVTFSGALVFAINNDKLELKGKIDHSAGGHFDQADPWDGFDYYDNTVKRSFYVNDNLFTFSNKYLKINSLDKLAEIKNLELTTGGDDYSITPTVSTSGSSTPNVADHDGAALPLLPSAPTSTASGTPIKTQ